MKDQNPKAITDFNKIPDWFEPYQRELLDRKLDPSQLHQWMADWTTLADLVGDAYARLNLATTQDTTDKEAEAQFNAFLDHIYPKAQEAGQQLKNKLLTSKLRPENFETPLRKMQVEADLFRQENLPLLTEERKLASKYNKVIGAQSITWKGEELTLQQMRRVFQDLERGERERAWRLAAERQLKDREELNEIWGKLIRLRHQLAVNADMADFRTYRWQQMLRLDYSPEDCVRFQSAIDQMAVPAATDLYDKYRKQLGIDRLRPWDLDQDLYPIHLPPLQSYGSVENLQSIAQNAFDRLSEELGGYFTLMRAEGLLDLDNRKGKAPGAYCTSFPITQQPFIFMNAVGLASDIRTILHESGHAFHNFARYQLPYAQQRNPGLEFAEVASMAMELLAGPYISAARGGSYPDEEARRFNIAHLERILAFWPYMAVVDAFQHWVYTHHELAMDPAQCDGKWLQLWERYLPGVDWSGLEDAAMTGWHRKQHVFRSPFYYVEYGLAQLGAVQIWRNAMHDAGAALASYRAALSLGGTATLPELYATAGAQFAFDAATLGEAVQLVQETIEKLEAGEEV